MRKALLPLFALFFIASCQPEIDFDLSDPSNNPPANPPGNPPPAVTGDLRAKINGVQWVADSSAGASLMNGKISIAGLSKDFKALTILVNDSGVHQYTITTDFNNVGSFHPDNRTYGQAFVTVMGTYPDESGGTLTITEIDQTNKRIKGSFAFKAFDEIADSGVVVTEGSFDLAYATTLPPGTGTGTDTLRCKINGVDFAPAAVFGIFAPSPINSLNVTGTNPTNTYGMGIRMAGLPTPGTYTFSFFGDYIGIFNPDTNPNNSTISDSGTLVILEHNTTTKRIRGTFNYVSAPIMNPSATNTISDGYFSVVYQ